MSFFFTNPQRERTNLNNTVILQRNAPTTQINGVATPRAAPPQLRQTASIFRQFPLYKVPPPIPPPTLPPIQVEPPKQEAKMTWGEPTWFLFHTLAEKVIDTHFSDVRAGLLNVIYSICLNLPCPKCAEHAKGHLNGINFNTIRTKEDLKMLLFDFHNLVNSRKGYAIYKYEDLKKYELAITKNIVHNFLIEYNKKSKNIRYLADDLHRERMASSLKKWLSENLVHFQE
jgi:hypothetical protein